MPSTRSSSTKAIPASRSTRKSANRPLPDPPAQTRPAKRRRPDDPQPTSSENSGPRVNASTSHSQRTQSIAPDRDEFDLELSELTLGNFESAKAYWPMDRINQQLAAQSSSNEVLGPASIALGQALLENFEHSLHMIAMITRCNILVLKRRLGLIGGMHGENTWHRWLSFSKAAQKHPMPLRGDPDAGIVLTFRNKANAAAYRSLSDDEFSIYTAPIFFALGGYPNYGAVNVTDLDNVDLDEILVPEVPQLSEAQNAKFRPIYEESVDLVKVAKDRESNSPAVTSSAIEKRSLQCYKKTSHQLGRDAALVGLDYLLIACSKSALGQGWCRVTSTQADILSWLNKKLNFEQLFPIYCQGKSDFDEIRLSLPVPNPAGQASNGITPRPVNASDIVKGSLTAYINEQLVAALGPAPPGRKKSWPRSADPINSLKKRKIDVEIYRDPQSVMTDDQWALGYNAMENEGRSKWLLDFKSGCFQILPPGGTPRLPNHRQAEGSGSAPGPSTDGEPVNHSQLQPVTGS